MMIAAGNYSFLLDESMMFESNSSFILVLQEMQCPLVLVAGDER
jgi:hypothetical protein